MMPAGTVEVPAGVGAAARAARADALDAWLATLLPDADNPDAGTLALVAVGGLARRECAPHGDLDLVLLHGGGAGIDGVAEKLWYPIWDAKLSLDHSVRTVDEAVEVAGTDVKAALGLLDARLIAGDDRLVARLRERVTAHWRRDAARALPRLRELSERRWAAHGELAFLLEGDVKEARGGLRDVGVLRGIGYAGVADATRPAVRAAQRWLLDVRDALHTVTGRQMDRMLAQERAEVARLLDLGGPDDVLRRVTDAARTIAYAADDAWRAVDGWRRSGHTRRGGATRWGGSTPWSGSTRWSTAAPRSPIARDVVEQNGEAVLARAAITPRPDPSLALRVAAAAARARLPVARPTLEWLAEFSTPLPTPWPAPARDALLTLLGAGDPLVPTWEACDRYGLVTAWLPEWARVRSLPQHNPVHRFTVDRHLVETARMAASYAREVSRPDLLMLSALLHDVGKGLPGDHSVVGASVAAAAATRIGLAPADAAVVERVVRLHLLLPDTATRRDLADPVTVRAVAGAVGDLDTLSLLYALVRADAAATGPTAWSAWKGRLVAELVDRAAHALDTGRVPGLPVTAAPVAIGPLPSVRVGRDRVAVTATDSAGLLAAVAGCLSLHRLDVVAADVATGAGVARVVCAVQPRYGGAPDVEALAADLRRAATGELDVAARLAARERSARRPAGAADPRVVWQPATGAAVLELRAADSPGLLHRVASALAGAGARVRSARISTLGGDVVDAFYLVGRWDDAASRSAVEAAVLRAVAPPR
ncbi:bifunctional uridylyltransferase/uridylyl-removing enzyme [Planosporangium mesophilum]|uniref:Bifunctional uridylyltransferase/uridylyl-removing enzyme n=2 Tax=Planosporangium mesophilum TaxID=689768 RepID=A0A8J3T5K2_9ACTN|nr:bifunctional uridylyltransferase/uridylyl-removing enzyme [Planosporangium mesophilum]